MSPLPLRHKERGLFISQMLWCGGCAAKGNTKIGDSQRVGMPGRYLARHLTPGQVFPTVQNCRT